MVDHDVVGLDISVDDLDDFMAVVEGFEHILEVSPHLAFFEPDRLHLLEAAFLDALAVVLLMLLVPLLHEVAQTTFRMILGDQVNVIFLGVIDDFVQVDDVRVVQPLQYYKLLFHAVVGILAQTRGFLLESLLVHLLDRVHVLRLRIDAELDSGE